VDVAASNCGRHCRVLAEWEKYRAGEQTDSDLESLLSILKSSRSKRASGQVRYGTPANTSSLEQVSETFKVFFWHKMHSHAAPPDRMDSSLRTI
jgi:hypothetical protein